MRTFSGVIYVVVHILLIVMIFGACVGSKNKHTVSTTIDTTKTETKIEIPAAELEAMGLEIEDSISFLPFGIDFKLFKDKERNVYTASKKETVYTFQNTTYVPTHTKYVDKRSIDVNINSNNNIKDKSEVDNSTKVDNSTSSNIKDKREIDNSSNSNNVSKKNNENSGNRWKLKFGGFPWWIWLILVALILLAAWWAYKKFIKNTTIL